MGTSAPPPPGRTASAPERSSTPASGAAGRESYVVVARRYRPQTFAELIGQEHVAQALAGAIASERVGHAYLFTGARGVGKTSAARILAKSLNCAAGMSATPCGVCEVCESVAAGDDVDVLEIDGASNRGIDEIRQLRQNAAVRPSRARFKIYIIDEVHMLTKEAFNALLKTLEEPPEHVKFIFATTEPNKIPITILSRCQRYDFAGIGVASIADRLGQIAAAEGVRIDPEALQLLAIRAAGSMRDSQSLLEQLLATGGSPITADDVTSLLGLAPAARLGQLVAALARRDAATALAQLDGAVAEGAEAGQVIDQLLGYFRDAMTQAVGCDAERLLYALPGQVDEIRAFAAQLGLETLLAGAQVLDQTAARMRVSTQGRTLAEMALVRIARLGNLQTLSDFLARLEAGAPLPEHVPAGAPQAAEPLKKNDLSEPAPPLPAFPTAHADPASADPASAVATAPVVPPRGASAASVPAADARAAAPAASGPEVEQPATRRAGSSPTAAIPPTPAAGTPAAETPATGTPAAGAPAAGTPAAGDAEWGDPAAVWRDAAQRLTGLLAEQAAAASRFRFDGSGRLVASFPESMKFSRDALSRPGHAARLSEALQAAAGRPVRYLLETHPDASGDAPRAVPPASRRQLQAEVAQRPFVRRAMELFQADESRLRYVPPQSPS